MANTFTVGTFNCHNLFSRSKVLNRIDETGAEVLMGKIGRLRDELGKPVYDKKKIIDLFTEINIDPDKGKPEAMIEIIDLHNKLFGRRKDTKELFVVPKGKSDWEGYIDFKKSKFSDDARLNTARVIHEMNADILSFIEIEDKSTLDAFNTELIGGKVFKKYPYTMVIDSINDQRGIDVALVSRYPFEDIRTYMWDAPAAGGENIFSRDCLEVKVRLSKDNFVSLFVNHFKSQGYGAPVKNDARRKQQTRRVAEILKERMLNLKQDKVAVLGDFNADRNSDSLEPLLSIPELKDILELQNLPELNRWTYCYRPSKNKITRQQLDYILVSEPLQAQFRKAEILRQGIFDLAEISLAGEQAWDTVQTKGLWAQASDHAAIWAEFSY